MKYMLLMYSNDTELQQYTGEPKLSSYKTWQAFEVEAKAAGVYLSNNALVPISDATTVRVRNGKTLTTDGPFAETHEWLGGYYLIDCKDLDEAISWAAKIPTAWVGSIEVRPLNEWFQK